MRSFGIVLLSHGKYAKETLETLTMIGGKQEGIVALELDANKSFDGFKNELTETLNELEKTYENLLVLCDIYGGTPFNVVMNLLLEGRDFIAYSGFNLPVVIGSAFAGDLNRQEINDLVKTSFKESLHDLKALASVEDLDDEEDL